jgi:KEOPS complex subunit Cgi121
MRVVEGRATIDNLDAALSILGAVADEHGVAVQAFDARYLVGRRHAERAVELADRAFARGENVARERSVEILLYAAGRRQIDDALRMGLDEGRTSVAIVVTAADGDERREAAAADAVTERLDLGSVSTLSAIDVDRVRDFFGVTDAELAAVDGDLTDLVRERVALLDVKK